MKATNDINRIWKCQTENQNQFLDNNNKSEKYATIKSTKTYCVDVHCLILRYTWEELYRPLNNIESNIPKQPDYTNYKCNKTQNLKNQKFNS